MQSNQQIFVAQLNAAHFRLMLSVKLSDMQRRTITRLLAEEVKTLTRFTAAAVERALSELLDLLAQGPNTHW